MSRGMSVVFRFIVQKNDQITTRDIILAMEIHYTITKD